MSKLVNGTTYHDDTPDRVIEILEMVRLNGTRIKICLGSPTTGEDWGEKHDVAGYEGRSCGEIKAPILIHNKRSTGGGLILDYCIVKIMESKGKRVLWQHPKYHKGENDKAEG